MGTKTATLRHPVRAVVIGGAVVALVAFAGSWVADVPGNYPPPLIALAVGLGYGLFLGAISVGWVLAIDLPAMRWWWAVLSLPWMCAGTLALGVANGADVFSGWFPIALRATYFVLVSWLIAGGMLAFAGWWRYVLRLATAVDD